ncbi:MAG: flagellar brake protein [Syntrophobacteraceae bacterium]|jgi:c-di-GMP-binding flagellar brake protein YcgR
MLQQVTEQILQGRILSIGIGTTLQFQLGWKGHELKAAGVLVGMSSDEYLMIRVPAIPGILSRLCEGDPIVVRYVYAGNVYGFTSTILTCIQKPALIVFIAYPTSVESMNLRKARRMQCLFPATVKGQGGDLKGLILDISLGGCKICIDNELSESLSIDVDQTIGISFLLTGTTEEQVINGRVQNMKKDDKHTEMGIQFDPENASVLSNVKLYMDGFAKLQFLPALSSSSERG